MKGLEDKLRYKRLAIAAVLLAVLYLALVTIVPGMSIWATGIDNTFDDYKRIEAGEEYSFSFAMPYDRLTKVGVDLKNVGENEKVFRIEAELILTDDEGNITARQDVNSVYEDSIDLSGKKVCEGERYTLTLRLDSTGNSEKGIFLGFNSDDRMFISVEGLHTGVDSKASFTFLYIVIAALLMIYVANMGQGTDRKRDLTDKTLFYAAIVMAVILLNQPFDLFMIAKGGLRFIDAVKSGHIVDFYDYEYDKEITLGTERIYVCYFYSVFVYLPVSILLIPFSFVADGDLGRGTLANSIVLYLDAIVAVATVLSVKLLDRTVKECDMPEEYGKSVRKMFAFSTILIYVTVAFGQIDIFYVILMLLALPYYFRGRYKIFSLIMSIVVVFKLIPLMVFIPMILLVNKKLKDIVINTAICVSATLVSTLVFERGLGYSVITEMVNESFSFADRLFEVSLGGRISVFVLLYAIICLICYMSNTDPSDKKELLYRSMLVMFASYGVFIVLVSWHIQWLIPLVLSLAFLFPFVKNDSRLLIADIAMETLLMGIIFFKEDTVYLLDYGSLSVSDYEYAGPSVKVVLEGISPLILPTFCSLLAALILFFIVYFAMDIRARSGSGKGYVAVTDHTLDRDLVTVRLFIFFGTLILYTWCYYFIG